jgi:hypothetical protein
MNMEREFSGDLQRLLDQFVDGTISDEGLAQLDETLRDRPDTVEDFLEFCQLHIDLTIDLRADHALETFRDRQQRVASPLISTPVAPLPTACDEVGHFGMPPTEQAFFGFSKFFALGIAACTVMLISVGGLWWWIDQRIADDRAPLRIAGTTNTSIPQVTSIKLNSGSSKLELAGIGTVAVEGPAEFELTGPMRARLNRGRIKVHVTQESGRGFVVETPDGEVTDLGTEFGLDVADEPGTGLVVFQGIVDLRVGETEQISDESPVSRLVEGDGVRFTKAGRLDRIMSVITSGDGMFQLLGGSEDAMASVITNVTDNIRTGDMKKFYEIVPGGLREDARAYVDRQEHEWNGLSSKGMPEYLVGADYVKPFNRDKLRQDIELEVTLSATARLFVIWDDRLTPPEWLKEGFERNGDRIGLDMGKSFTDRGEMITNSMKETGPGNSIDQKFSIWEKKDVANAGKVKLGATGAKSRSSAMYGIAALRVDATKQPDAK